MLKIRTSILALAAIASLSAAALVSTSSSADARGFGGGGMSFHGSGMSRGGFSNGGFNRGGFRHASFNQGHFRPYWNHYRHWHRPWTYGVGAVAATSYAVAPTTVGAAPRCTCLTKEYTQDGLVVFQDVCTKEVASAPVGNTQAQVPQQQAPGQQ